VVIVTVLFVLVTLPATWNLVGNTLSMVGLPTHVTEVTDSNGQTCQNVPVLLTVVHGLVLGGLTVCLLKWWSKQ